MSLLFPQLSSHKKKPNDNMYLVLKDSWETIIFSV